MSLRCVLVLMLLHLSMHVQGATIDDNRYSRSLHAQNHDEITDVSHSNLTSPHNDSDSNHGNHSNHGDSHHGIHVASWNFLYVQEPLIITLAVLIAGACKIGYHHANFLSSYVPESCVLIIFGTVFGAIFYFSGSSFAFFPSSLSPKLFFLYLLPPSILEASYSLHDRTFADNVGAILLYAVVGTVFNCFIIGGLMFCMAAIGAMGAISLSYIQIMVFCSLIVAVDPVAVLAIFEEIGVNNVLYFLVFGESLLNDAVTVVLYNMMKTFNEMEEIPPSQVLLGVVSFFTISLGGLIIGVFFGILCALCTKYTTHVRVVEPMAIFGLAYCSYLCAEMFHFSGIISLICCGLMQAQYSFHNISHKSHTTVKYFSKMMSSTADCIIFIFLGLSLVHDSHVWHTGFVLWALFLCLAVRFLVVFGLTFLVNAYNKVRRVNIEEQFIMAYGGLRGAVAFSLVNMLDAEALPQKAMFETTALVVILFTVFVQGTTIKPLVKLMRIQGKDTDEKPSILKELDYHVTDHMLAGIEEIMGHFGRNFFREKLGRFDDRFLKYWLQRNPNRKDDYIMELYEEIALKEHYEHIGGADLDHYLSTHSVDTEQSEKFEELPNDDDDERKTKKPIPSLQKLVIESSLDDPSIGVRKKPLARQFAFNNDDPTKSHPQYRQSAPTSADIRNLLIRSPTHEVYHQHYDRNLTREEKTDLLFQLQQRQERNLRLHRSLTHFPSVSSINEASSPGAQAGVSTKASAHHNPKIIHVHQFSLPSSTPKKYSGNKPGCTNKDWYRKKPYKHRATSLGDLQEEDSEGVEMAPLLAEQVTTATPTAQNHGKPNMADGSQDIDRFIQELETQRHAIKGGDVTPKVSIKGNSNGDLDSESTDGIILGEQNGLTGENGDSVERSESAVFTTASFGHSTDGRGDSSLVGTEENCGDVTVCRGHTPLHRQEAEDSVEGEEKL